MQVGRDLGFDLNPSTEDNDGGSSEYETAISSSNQSVHAKSRVYCIVSKKSNFGDPS